MLTISEIKTVIEAMLDLLGASKTTDAQSLANECMKNMDLNHDGVVSNGIKCLLFIDYF